ncbi:DUF4837 family protein [Algivirga pacifica]|uniref:DUF4837 family protein n=1 Tax=Algivirga pacifica TaxID=1162670 RepID=A0ABP9CYA0_9BACT
MRISHTLKVTYFFVLSLVLFAYSCEEPTKEEKKKERLSSLGSSIGGAGEIVLVMDSAQWAGELGEVVYEEVVGKPINTLPQTEPMFKVNVVRPDLLNGFMNKHRNIVMFTTLDSNSDDSRRMKRYFSDKAIEKVMKGGKTHIQLNRNVYAKGQAVVLVFAPTEADMIAFLREEENSQKINRVFNEQENDRVYRELKKANDPSVARLLDDAVGIKIKSFSGYKKAEETEDFIWLRHIGRDVDYSIFVGRKPYKDASQFSLDSILAWREEITKAHLFGDPERKDETYLVTEDKIPVESKSLTLDGRYAVEVKGLWKTKNNTMGGPFVSYVITDKEGSDLLYIEGFIYAPSRKKREYMRELEVTLKSLY